MRTLQEMLGGSLWSGALSPAQFDWVAHNAFERRVPAGGFVVRTGTPADHWFGVIEGLAKMSITTADGRAATFTGVTTGGWFGEGSLLKTGEKWRYDSIALRETRLACIPRRIFTELLATSLGFNRFILAHLNARLSLFISLAEFEGNELIARTLAHLDFNRIQKRAPSPVSFFGRQSELLSGFPVGNVERTAARDTPCRTAFRNPIARPSQLRSQFRRRRVPFDDDRIDRRRYIPAWVRYPERRGHRFRSQGRSIMKFDSTPQPEPPALVSRFRLPRGSERRLQPSVIVHGDKRFEHQAAEVLAGDGVGLGLVRGVERSRGDPGRRPQGSSILRPGLCGRQPSEQQTTDRKPPPGEKLHSSPFLRFATPQSRSRLWFRSTVP